MHTLYILVSNHGHPDSMWGTEDREHAIGEARMDFTRSVFDFHRHKLKQDSLLASEIDHGLRLVKLTYGGDEGADEVDEVCLPFQMWLDEIRVEWKEEMLKEERREKMKDDPEWAKYVQLRKKFENF